MTTVLVHRFEQSTPGRIQIICIGLILGNLEEGRYAALQGFPVRHPGQLVDGDVGLGAHVDAGAALRVEVVQALKALLAAGAVRLQVAFARLVG